MKYGALWVMMVDKDDGSNRVCCWFAGKSPSPATTGLERGLRFSLYSRNGGCDSGATMMKVVVVMVMELGFDEHEVEPWIWVFLHICTFEMRGDEVERERSLESCRLVEKQKRD